MTSDAWLVAPADAPPPPPSIRRLCGDLADGLIGALGDDLVSFYLFGAMAFPRPPGWLLDIDFHVLLAQPPKDHQRVAVNGLHRRLAGQHPLGDELDGHYLLSSDAGRRDRPTCRMFGNTDTAWALHRAHVLAGRFFLLVGRDPRPLLPPPTWEELEASLDAEMRYVVDHPQHEAFGLLNACRVLYSVRTGDVVVSKYAAAQWGMDALAEWRAGLAAAVRIYSDTATSDDPAAVAEARGPFVAHVAQATGMPRRTNPP